MAGAGWYPDPLGRAQVRYFDGTEWSQWAADDGRSRLDAEAVLTALPPPPDAPPPGMPPPPGTGWTPAQPGGLGQTQQFRSVQGLSTALMWVLIGVAVAAAATALVRVARTRRDRPLPRHRQLRVRTRTYKDGDDAVGGHVEHSRRCSTSRSSCCSSSSCSARSRTRSCGMPPKERWTPGWAIGGWFIPLANFVIPFLVVLETWRRSDPDVRRRREGPSIDRPVVGLVAAVHDRVRPATQVDPYDDPTFDEVKTRDGSALPARVLLDRRRDPDDRGRPPSREVAAAERATWRLS